MKLSKKLLSVLLSVLLVLGTAAFACAAPVRADPEMTVTGQDLVSGKTAVFTARLPADATGTVTFFLDYADTGTKIAVKDGAAVLAVKLDAGTHNVLTVYGGDDKYTDDSDETDFVVTEAEPETAPADVPEEPAEEPPAPAKESFLSRLVRWFSELLAKIKGFFGG